MITEQEAQKRESYANYVSEIAILIRKRYSQDDELAILRQRDTKPEEFEEYNTYAEWCKLEAKKT